MRLLRIFAGVLAALLVVVIGLVLLAPSTTTRLVAGRAAAWSGVQVDGLETLDVSLADARVSGGPLSFGEGNGRRGRFGQFRADLDGSQLLSGKTVFEELLVADADLELTIDDQGRPALNGIPLGPSSAQAPQAQPATEGGLAFPAIGVHQATVERARLELSRGHGRPLPIVFDRARLTDLSPETPETPARFDIAGSAGAARFAYRGEAKVFGDPVDVVLDGGFDGLSLADLEALAGPLGLSRAEGRFASSGRHRLTLAGPGNVEVASTGSLTAADTDVAVGSTKIRLERGTVGLDAIANVSPERRVELRNKGPLNIAGLVVAWSETGAVRVAAAKLEANLEARSRADGGGEAKIRGSVPLSGLVVAWSEIGAVHLDQGTARIDLELASAADGGLRIAGPMGIRGEGGGVRSGGSFQLAYQRIDADFPDAVIGLPADGTATVNGKPVATLSGFSLAAPLQLQAASAVATSKALHVVSPAEGVLVEFDGGLDLKDAATPVDERKRLLARSLTLHLAQMRYDEAASGAAQLKSDIGARAGGVQMEGKDAVPFPVRDGALTLAGLDLALTPDGGIRRLALAPETEAVLEGVARGRPHHLTLALDRFQITDLDPDVPDQLTRADIIAVVNERGRIELSEEVKPFARPPEFVFKGSIRDLELPELSPYLAALAGLNAESGRFAATGQAIAASGRLKGVVDVDIQTLDLVPAAKKGRDPAVDLTGVPVELAIALLEDADRRIDVSLPFSGDLTSPKVNYCGVIRTALAGAVRLVVTGPLGADQKGGTTGPGPVPFDAGSAALNPEATRQLERVAGVLAKRPRLHLQVCGRATGADARALEGAAQGGAVKPGDAVSMKMLALAQERSRVALARLQGFAGVGPDQVQECRPTADATDAGSPRAEARF